MSQCILDALESIDVGLGNFIVHVVAVIPSHADNGTCDGVCCILVDDWVDVSQSSHALIACMKIPVMSSSNDKWLSRVRSSTSSYEMNGTVTPGNRDPARLIKFGNVLACPYGNSLCFMSKFITPAGRTITKHKKEKEK